MNNYSMKNMLYNNLNISEFIFENITAPSMYNFITLDDIKRINSIVNSVVYTSKVKEKYSMIDSILKIRGFYRIGAGTNRLIYKNYEYPNAVLKVAAFRGALTDGIREIQNQYLLKPFCTKIFEVSQCGTVSWCEYVKPIKKVEEFISVYEDIYDIIINKFIGKYILDDFGSKYFMNWGLREGFGPVILDFPYVYKLDGNKLICNRPSGKYDVNGNEIHCGGFIDYDDGFNQLICTKCGSVINPSDLENNNNEDIKLIYSEEDTNMKIVLKYEDKIIKTFDTSTSTNTINSDDENEFIKAKVVNKKAPKKFKRIDLEKIRVNNIRQNIKGVKTALKNNKDKYNIYNGLDTMHVKDYSKILIEKSEDNSEIIDVSDDDYKDEDFYEKEFNLKPVRKSKKEKNNKYKMKNHEKRFSDNSDNEFYINQY